MLKFREPNVLPGFGITLGLTLTYLALIVLIPLAGLFITTAGVSFSEFWQTITAPRVMSAYQITFGASFAAAVMPAGVKAILTPSGSNSCPIHPWGA